MKVEDKPIGFFDSGVGGISVLAEAVKMLPGEDFIYFGDSKNAPYGTRSVEEVKELTFNAVDFLRNKNVKALVVACNTATSVAITDLREKYSSVMPIIGIEPALKPAVEYKRNGSILIMATPMTLSESKFNNLMKNYKDEAEIKPLPCPGLVELIESGKIEDEDIYEYLENKVRPFQDKGIAAIVLGCTHYPFIRKALSRIVSEGVPIVDGSKGTVRQLQRQLSEYNILNRRQQGGKVEINNSLGTEEIINLSYKFLRLEEY